MTASPSANMSTANLTNSDSCYKQISVVKSGLLFTSSLLQKTQFLLHSKKKMKLHYK